METRRIIESWYKALGFPRRYDEEFYEALNTLPISDTITIETYDLNEQDGKRNFLSFLYFCEALKAKYEELGIGNDILMDTLRDLLRWTDVWSDLKGELYLGEIPWLAFHMRGKLFCLGALQFALGQAEHDVPEKGIAKGDNVVEVHIPANTDFSKEECDKSFAMAKVFFAKYFPEREYRYFTCDSWLLDHTLKQFLKSESKIIDFQNRFDVVKDEERDSIFRYIFRWDATRETALKMTATTSLAQKVQEYARDGGVFYVSLGVIDKDTI
ncbi:MAG: DUF5596 domain-containing protein [Clostridia bacterium]|nr:DUF5596 domain-containing protein [Clostridia bacterium]